MAIVLGMCEGPHFSLTRKDEMRAKNKKRFDAAAKITNIIIIIFAHSFVLHKKPSASSSPPTITGPAQPFSL